MRWQLAALVGVCAALWIDALAGGRLAGGTPALVVVAAVALVGGVHCDPLPLGVAGVGSAALLSVADQVAEPGRFSLASDGIFYCVVVLAPAFLGWLVASRNRQVAQLQCRRRDLEHRRDVAVQVARAGERERVARRIDLSLADQVRQVVANVRRAGDLAASRPEGVPARLAEVEDAARAALAELRDVLGTLYGPRSAEARGPEPRPSTARPVPARGGVRFGLVDVALLAAAVPLAIETALPGHHGPAVLNVFAALAQGSALVLLRRRPAAGVFVLLAIAAGQTAVLSPLPPTVSWLLPGLLAAFLLGVTPSRWTSWLGLAILLAGVVGVSAATPAAHRATAGLLPGLVMGVLVWAGGRLAAARNARARELRAITDELHRGRQDEAHLAALDQRAEIARDLHDAGAHALTVVCLQAGAARAWWERDPGQAGSALESLAAVADTTLAHVGQSLGGLARGIPDNVLDPDGLEVLIGIGRALGLGVDIAITGLPRPVPDDVVTVAYRVVQEGLTNAARHAAGSTVRIGLAYVSDALEVRVCDDGADSSAHPIVSIAGAAAGLRGMRERVEGLRGELRAGRSGRGFEILARLPT